MDQNIRIRSKHSTLLSGCRRTAERRGAAVVEFAVVAPVLILLLLGMIECGRMIMVQQTITTAAREGARSAIVEGNSATTATTSVQSFLAGTGIRGAQITVAPKNTGSVVHGQPITVTVSVPFSAVSWLPHPFFFGERTLTSTATMRRETPN
jgi:Flp pilus assembly protein TadG